MDTQSHAWQGITFGPTEQLTIPSHHTHSPAHLSNQIYELLCLASCPVLLGPAHLHKDLRDIEDSSHNADDVAPRNTALLELELIADRLCPSVDPAADEPAKPRRKRSHAHSHRAQRSTSSATACPTPFARSPTILTSWG
jgi:hypothetical protein